MPRNAICGVCQEGELLEVSPGKFTCVNCGAQVSEGDADEKQRKSDKR